MPKEKKPTDNLVGPLLGITPVVGRRIIGCTVLLLLAIVGYSAIALYQGNTLGQNIEPVIEVLDLPVVEVDVIPEQVVVAKIVPVPSPMERGKALCHVLAGEMTQELSDFALTNGCSTGVIEYLTYPIVCNSLDGDCATL